MSKVKTYAVNCNDAWLNTDGDDISRSYVKYADYLELAVQLANSESKCRALAAELSAVDKTHNEAVFITDDHYEQCPPEVQKMIRSLAVLQIPDYDAFLAEVRAQGVDIAIAELKQLAHRSEKEAPIAAEHHRSAALYLQLFSSQLRLEPAQ